MVSWVRQKLKGRAERFLSDVWTYGSGGTIAQKGKPQRKQNKTKQKREKISRSGLCIFMFMPLGLANACGGGGIDVSPLFFVSGKTHLWLVQSQKSDKTHPKWMPSGQNRLEMEWPQITSTAQSDSRILDFRNLLSHPCMSCSYCQSTVLPASLTSVQPDSSVEFFWQCYPQFGTSWAKP